jgi:steroid delta-isomerase-like uncharacterized protein
MSTEGVRFVKTWFEEIWNKGRLSAVDEMLASSAVLHGLGEAGEDVVGPAGFRPFVERLRGAFNDIHVTVEQTVEEGDMIAARYVVHMTHTGPDIGLAPSGTRATVTGMSISRLENGKLVEGWNNWDQLSLLQQIGAIQPQAQLLP